MSISLRSKPNNYYLGNYDQCFYGYSADENIRKNAASGGMVSQLLIYMLKNNYIDGAVVSNLSVENGEFITRTFIARTVEEVLYAQSSIYIDFPLGRVFKEVESFKGRLAIVALPCQFNKFDKLSDKDRIIKIGLFCGHTSKKKLIEEVLKNKVDITKIESFCFRRGHWRGYSHVRLKSNEVIKFPYFDFGMFQNMFFHMPQKCLYCRDHTAETSDVSFGDIWLNEFKKKGIKHSCIISRNKKITDILCEMKEKNIISINTLSSEKIIKSQQRPLIYHKFTTNALRKIKLGDSEYEFKWNDYIAALLILFNMSIAEKKIVTIIYKLPKKLVFLYMIFLRIFLSF